MAYALDDLVAVGYARTPDNTETVTYRSKSNPAINVAFSAPHGVMPEWQWGTNAKLKAVTDLDGDDFARFDPKR